MNSHFPRIITLLRKEKNISQKKAATDLGISQALLSHYEKGIRECGLEFLVKTATYYNVSCDYLLGISPEPEGKTISLDEIPEGETGKERVAPGAMTLIYLKKIIINSINILFSLLIKSKCNTLAKQVPTYLMLAVYKMFRTVYVANSKNDDKLFSIPDVMVTGSISASMSLSEAASNAAARGLSVRGNDCVKKGEELFLTTTTLAEEYPQYSSSLLNLIKNSENEINKLNIE